MYNFNNVNRAEGDFQSWRSGYVFEQNALLYHPGLPGVVPVEQFQGADLHFRAAEHYLATQAHARAAEHYLATQARARAEHQQFMENHFRNVHEAVRPQAYVENVHGNVEHQAFFEDVHGSAEHYECPNYHTGNAGLFRQGRGHRRGSGGQQRRSRAQHRGSGGQHRGSGGQHRGDGGQQCEVEGQHRQVGGQQRESGGPRQKKMKMRHKSRYFGGIADVKDLPKHPPHLKGRDIGLFYRNRNKEEKSENKNTIPILSFSTEGIKSVEEILAYLDGDANFDKKNEVRPLRTHFQREYLDITTVSFMEKLEQSITYRNNRVDAELLESRNEELRLEMINKMQNKTFLNMLEFRKGLPTYKHRTEILRAVRNNQVIIVSGDTGCGKSTQVGQLILEEACRSSKAATVRILITQPRRLAATSVAARIADERAEILGNSVGFAIRLESMPAREYGSITVVTAGVVLQMLQNDPALADISHLIIDEAHERDTTCDILLGIVKMILSKRKDLKVILMSATMDSERFCQYFNDCPKVEIPGMMYPVEIFHLEDALEMTGFTDFRENGTKNVRSTKRREILRKDKELKHKRKMEPYIKKLQETGKYKQSVLDTLMKYQSEGLSVELAVELVKKLCQTQPAGAILVFMPGLSHISDMCKSLQKIESEMPKHVVYPLHSQLSSLDQNAIFREPPEGVRKIIVSTNIAETSITINDVVYVVDCGRMKVTNYDVENDIKMLTVEWISHANALQRQGRAGRVRPGKCYRLYSGMVFSELQPRILPEIIRAPVHEPLLASLLLRLHPAPQFLASLIDPPQDTAVRTAVKLLTRMNILNENEHLTSLGVHVARLPVSPGAARMLIYASLLSAVSPITRIAAVVAFKDPFSFSIGQEREVEECRLAFSHGTYSDQLAAAEAQRQWEQIREEGSRRESYLFCRENFLSERTLQMLLDMRHQFGKLLYDGHFISSPDPDDEESNEHSNKEALLKALIVAGLYPNVAYYKVKRRLKANFLTLEDGRVDIHPSSVNAFRHPHSKHIVYRLKQLTSALYIHDTSPAHVVAMLFFGDRFRVTEDENTEGNSVVWCGEFCWTTKTEWAQLITRLREDLHALLQDRLENPRPVCWNSREGVILSAIIELLEAENVSDLCQEEESDSQAGCSKNANRSEREAGTLEVIRNRLKELENKGNPSEDSVEKKLDESEEKECSSDEYESDAKVEPVSFETPPFIPI